MSTTEAQRLTAWFDECDGFRQATAAPHKWVLQADAELRRLNDQVEKLTKARDELVNAIDNEMVVTHMGAFNAGDDPKVALNKICCYAQDLGQFFADDGCKEQLTALAEQNEKMRAFLENTGEHSPYCDVFTLDDEGRHKDCTCGLTEALSLPDLASPVLNRIRAEGMEEAEKIIRKLVQWGSNGHGIQYRSTAPESISAETIADEIRARAVKLRVKS